MTRPVPCQESPFVVWICVVVTAKLGRRDWYLSFVEFYDYSGLSCLYLRKLDEKKTPFFVRCWLEAGGGIITRRIFDRRSSFRNKKKHLYSTTTKSSDERHGYTVINFFCNSIESLHLNISALLLIIGTCYQSDKQFNKDK